MLYVPLSARVPLMFMECIILYCMTLYNHDWRMNPCRTIYIYIYIYSGYSPDVYNSEVTQKYIDGLCDIHRLVY